MKKTPPPESSPRFLFARASGRVIAWLVLTLYFLLPPRVAMSWGLDASNYGSYSWMLAAGRQFGGDTVAMIGPFGFLAYGHTYSGYLFFEYLFGDFLFKAAFAFLVLQVFRRNPAGIWRWLWLVGVLIFLPSVDDLIYDAAVLVAAVALWRPNAQRTMDFTAAVAAGLLGFSVLMKGSHATLAGAALAFAVASDFFRADRKRAGGILVVALATFLGGWLCAGQHLGNLPGYFHALFALTEGYNGTMGLDATPRWLIAGTVLAGLLFAALLVQAFVAPESRHRKLGCGFFALFTFLQWKHGFVRADGHVFMFFGFVALVAPLLPMTLWIVDPAAAARRRLGYAAACCGLAFLGAAAATSSFSVRRLGELLQDVPERVSRNLHTMLSPRTLQRHFAQELLQQKQRADLADVRREVGRDSIDFWGYEQGIILLNELNYRPRPMSGGSFNVYHPHLQQLNGRFLRDEARRPDFFLLKLQTIDRRLPAADDPLTLQGLIAFYQPILAQRDYVLFEKRALAALPEPRPLASRSITLGEWVDVPAVDANQLLLFSLTARPSFVGALRGLFYHPPLFNVAVATAGDAPPENFRLSPLAAQVPVLLSPLLTSTSDVISLYSEPSSARGVRSLRFDAPQGGFQSSMAISFFTLPKPALAPAGVTDEIATYLAHPLSNRAPLSITTQATGITELFGEPVSLVHAPGSIVFPVETNDQQVLFSFGLMPQAYDPGETDGVEFIAEYLQGDRPPQLLFSRLLQPRTVAKDRGMQSARVFFPPQIAAGTLRLRTERGPAGNGAWDQSYFAHVQVERGSFDPRQLSGFSNNPEPPGFPDPKPSVLEGREIWLLPPPGEVRFAIPPASRFVTVALGVLPAASEGENHSDGIGCEIALIQPDGSTQILLQRTLDPQRDRHARGVVTLDLPLPNSAPDARLAIRINGGPQQDLRWDWSYVQTVRFR